MPSSPAADVTPAYREHATTVLPLIANRSLGFETLTAANSDAEDFREVSVWQAATALRESYEAGYYRARTDLAAEVHALRAELDAARTALENAEDDATGLAAAFRDVAGA